MDREGNINVFILKISSCTLLIFFRTLFNSPCRIKLYISADTLLRVSLHSKADLEGGIMECQI